jgi:DNA-binding LytR/AlgR family response regulator
VEAQGNYVALHLEKRAALVRQPLKEIEGRLKPLGFLRTHRSALINPRSVRAIRRDELGDLKVELTNGELAPLAAGHKASVVSALAGE